MKNTIVTGTLIVFSDGFVWKRLSNEKAYKIWVSAENEDFELYKIRIGLWQTEKVVLLRQL